MVHPREDLENHWLKDDRTVEFDGSKYHLEDFSEYLSMYWLPLDVGLSAESNFNGVDVRQYDHNKLLLELKRLCETYGDK